MKFEQTDKQGVVQSMIERANQGMLIRGAPGNMSYQRSCDTYHSPSRTFLGLSREIVPLIDKKAWHLSISFKDGKEYLPFDENLAAEWIALIFHKWSTQLFPMPGVASTSIRHYLLLCPGDEFIDLTAH